MGYRSRVKALVWIHTDDDLAESGDGEAYVDRLATLGSLHRVSEFWRQHCHCRVSCGWACCPALNVSCSSLRQEGNDAFDPV